MLIAGFFLKGDQTNEHTCNKAIIIIASLCPPHRLTFLIRGQEGEEGEEEEEEEK